MEERCALILLFVLSTEVEGHHHGDNDHSIIGGDGAVKGQHSKNGSDYHGYDGLHFDEVCKVFRNSICCLLYRKSCFWSRSSYTRSILAMACTARQFR